MLLPVNCLTNTVTNPPLPPLVAQAPGLNYGSAQSAPPKNGLSQGSRVANLHSMAKEVKIEKCPKSVPQSDSPKCMNKKSDIGKCLKTDA